MARPRKTYSQEEINKMTEKKMLKLFEDGRIDDDMAQRWYDNKAEEAEIVAQATEEFGMEEEMDIMEMERANRVAMEVTDKGYVAHFYRTHKHVGDIEVETVDGTHSAEAREMARGFAIDQCPQYGIEWNPEPQKQAWERKYNIYMDEEQISEDAITLVSPSLDRLAEKSRYDMMVTAITVSAVMPKESQFTYVENGRYTKSGAWCVADIELEVTVAVGGYSISMPFMMEMKSGQICKPKMTIAEWNEMVAREMELNGIELAEEQTA